ncbi:MAG: YkvA family protein [Gemmatimonadaceae bacterium]
MTTESEARSVRKPGERKRRGRRAAAQTSSAESVTPGRGAKRTIVGTIRQLPDYLRMLIGMLLDARVSAIDKLMLGGAIAYIVMPLDLMPDFIPFIGQVDDIYLLMLAIQRLIGNAGRRVLADHWAGPLEDLNPANIQRVLLAASFFLPRRLRRRIRAIGRG